MTNKLQFSKTKKTNINENDSHQRSFVSGISFFVRSPKDTSWTPFGEIYLSVGLFEGFVFMIFVVFRSFF